MDELREKVILIADCSPRTTSKVLSRLSRLGASLSICVQSQDDAQRLSKSLSGDNLLCTTAKWDKADFAEHLIAKTVEKFGKIDHLVFLSDDYEEKKSEDSQRMSNDNKSNVVKLAEQHIRKANGMVINVFRATFFPKNLEEHSKNQPLEPTKNMRLENVNVAETAFEPTPEELANLIMFFIRNNAKDLQKASLALFFGFATIASVLALLIGPISQPQSYHDFADKRKVFGIPYTADVISNVGFTVVGGWALYRLRHASPSFRQNFVHSVEMRNYQAFFLIIGLTGIGSAYYHLHPNNDALVFDRLPIAMATLALLGALIAERVSIRLAQLLSAPLILFGFASCIHWWWTEHSGQGDLRLYAFVTMVPAICYPLLLIGYPTQFSGTLYLVTALTFFALARLTESTDKLIFRLTAGIVAGHTLKHIFMTLAVFLVALYVRNRRPIERATYYLTEIQTIRRSVHFVSNMFCRS